MSNLQQVARKQGLADCAPVGLNSELSVDPLLEFAGPVDELHILVVTADNVNLLCTLLRCGCAAASAIRNGFHFDRNAYDIVMAPQVVEATEIGRLIYRAKHALVPTGRFIAFVPAAASTASEEMVGLLMRSLRLSGFVLVQTKTAENGFLIKAELPMHGLASAAPRLTQRQA